MIEISTTTIDRDRLSQIIARAKKKKGFVRAPEQMAALTLKRPSPPDLRGFLVDNMMPLSLVGRGHIALADFLCLAAGLRGQAESCILTLEIPVSGQAYDPEEESDLVLGIGFDWLSPKISLEMGGISPGSADLEYRKSMFEKVLNATGLDDEIELGFEGGELTITSGTFEALGDGQRSSAIEAASSGARFYRTNVKNGRGNNFRHLSLYFQSDAEMADAAERCVACFSSGEADLYSRVAITCTRDTYSAVRTTILGASRVNAWSLLFMAKKRYGLDSIDKMLSETDSMLMPLFEIQNTDVGAVFVDIYHNKGAVSLFFANEGIEPEAAEEVIRDIVAELADGASIIDEAAK